MGQYLNPKNTAFSRAELLLDYEVIWQEDFRKHLNQLNVIQLDIAVLMVTMPKGNSLTAYLQACVIRELRDAYLEIVGLEASSLPLFFADINEHTGDRSIAIIDEWDAIFRKTSTIRRCRMNTRL